MEFTWLGIQICICWSPIPEKKSWGLDQKTSQCLVWPPFSSCPSHRVDQALDCNLWNIVPLLFDGYAKLLDIGRNWNKLSYTSIQSIPNMLNWWWHVWWVCRPWKNWNISASRNCVQILATWSRALSCWNMRWLRRQWASGSRHSISVHSNCYP